MELAICVFCLFWHHLPTSTQQAEHICLHSCIFYTAEMYGGTVDRCQRDCVPWMANVTVKWGITLYYSLNNSSEPIAVEWRSSNLLWPDPIWTDSGLVPQSSDPVLPKRKTCPTMSQSIRDLKFGYSPLLMKPAPCPRHTTSGPWPKETAVFIISEFKHPNVKTCHAKRQLRLVLKDGVAAIFSSISELSGASGT